LLYIIIIISFRFILLYS